MTAVTAAYFYLHSGAMKPLRSRPLDFRASFIALGWGTIEQHYGAHATTVRRWVNEEGRAALIAERAAYVARLRDRDRAFRRRAAALDLGSGRLATAINFRPIGQLGEGAQNG